MTKSGITQKSEELKKLWEIIYRKLEKPRNIGANNDVYDSYGRLITKHVLRRKEEDDKIKLIKTETLYEYRKVMQLLDKESYVNNHGEYRNFSYPILNTLAIAGGFSSWDDYMQKKCPEKYSDLLMPLDKGKSSEPLFDVDTCNNIAALEIGKQITVGWYPVRFVKLEYLGEFKFKAIESNRRKRYVKDVFIYADKFEIEIPLVLEENESGYPMCPLILVSYRGEIRILNLGKKQKKKK